MASVGTILPGSTAAASGSATSGSSSSTSTAASGNDALANEGTFLQLLVAQLKNQDPSQPVQGTTFVTQLAQFSTLEQELASRQDLDKVVTDLTPAAATTSSGTPASGTTGSSSTSGS